MLDDTVCLWCGETERVELFEFWESGEFLIETCCEGTHEAVVDEMNRDPAYREELLRHLGVEDYSGNKLRRVPDCDGQFLLDFNLVIRDDLELNTAKEFIALYHEHNKAPAGWKYGASIWNGTRMIGVVTVGRPVARMLDHTTIVEANRVCIRRDIPAELRWNACSQLYGWAARQAKRRGYHKIITYVLESEEGIALKAAGWERAKKPTRGGSWNRPSRIREVVAPTCRKWRWERVLRATPTVERQHETGLRQECAGGARLGTAVAI